jgi:hypothetical protein
LKFAIDPPGDRPVVDDDAVDERKLLRGLREVREADVARGRPRVDVERLETAAVQRLLRRDLVGEVVHREPLRVVGPVDAGESEREAGVRPP